MKPRVLHLHDHNIPYREYSCQDIFGIFFSSKLLEKFMSRYFFHIFL